MKKNQDKYKENMDMKNLQHLKEVSSYNHNYYIGIGKDLLFALSDDDNTTEWFIISGFDSLYLGESYVSRGDLLNKYESRRT